MTKSVLIITPYFAPQSHAAVFRAYKLAKYLPRLGWKPYVLTVGTNYVHKEDPGLLQRLPREVEIHTAPYLEPSLRGIRMALGGKNRTQSSLGGPGEAKPDGALARPGWTRDAYGWALKHWLQVPDSYWTWKGPAIRKARELIRSHRIPIVMTSSSPFSTLAIGRELQRTEGVKWVADFRDPLTYEHRMFSPIGRVYLKQRALEREAVFHADALTCLTSASELILTDSYGLSSDHPIHFIPTGLEDELVPSASEAGTARPGGEAPFLMFAGEYLASYGSDFLEVFARALKDPEVRKLGVKLRFVGRLEINRPVLEPHLRRLGLENDVEFIDYLPQKALYALMMRAKGMVLSSSRRYGWWVFFAKLVDYLALERPVIAMVPDPSEARKWLTRAGLGTFLDGSIEESTAKLKAFLTASDGALLRPDRELCARFMASKQAEAFRDVFEGLL